MIFSFYVGSKLGLSRRIDRGMMAKEREGLNRV